ncbi:hypothetical protein Btru_043738 [Bulinus truncatus]|nr:hypothetical protein Btru_043738 [Bulinus truncatus]
MALETCDQLHLSYEDSFCLPVRVEKEQDTFTVDQGWIAGAFFLGLFIGVGIVAIFTKPFLNALKKKKQQDEEKLLSKTGKAEIIAVKEEHEKPDKVSRKSAKGKTFTIPRFWRRKYKHDSVNERNKNEINEDEVDPSLLRGMVDIMQQTSSLGSKFEMAEQDMTTIISHERSMEEERETLMLKTLALLLKKKAERRVITQNFYLNFIKKTETEVKDLTKMIEREKEEAEEKIRADPKLSKDIQTQENEMQKIHTFYNNKKKKLEKEMKNKIRQELLRSSGMSEADVDMIIEKLMNNLAVVDEKMGIELARQKRALEQRLAKRKRDIEFKIIEDKETLDDIAARAQILKYFLAKRLKDKEKENQIDEIISDYSNELESIHKYHTKDYQEKCAEKYEFLRKNRLASAYKLMKKQEKEKVILLQTADKSTNTVETIKQYHDLMIKHHMEQEALCEELDQKEVLEIAKLKQNVVSEENKALEKEAKNLAEKLENGSLSITLDAEKIIKLHKAQMSEYHARKQREKQAIMARLQEQLQQRILAADEAETIDLKEQELLKEEQKSKLSKVLALNLDLNEDAKNRILREHEQNMQVLSNQLVTSKLRQQKSLEIKLIQRKAHLLDLKQKQEDLIRSKKLLEQKENSELETKLVVDIAKEEQAFEDDMKKAISELRQQLSRETEEALKLQDEELSLLIGRLEVGQARRKAILENQGMHLKQLQEDFEKKMLSGVSLPPSLADQIIQQHYNQVTYLNDQLQQRKKRQEKTILDKIRAKQQQKEEDIETKLEEEAREEYTVQQKKGAGLASLALMQMFLDQRHTNAMQELETEMFAELEKCKNELNAELEEQLKKDLEMQHKDFLTQLAEVSKMSKSDLQEALTATASGKKDNRAAKQLANDLRGGMKTPSKDFQARKKSLDNGANNMGLTKQNRHQQPVDSDDSSEEMSDGSTGF